jgi:hypothetical protein
MNDTDVVYSRDIFMDIKDIVESWIGYSDSAKDLMIFHIDRIFRFYIQIQSDLIRKKGQGKSIVMDAIKGMAMNCLFKIGRGARVEADTKREKSDREGSIHFLTDTDGIYCCCKNSTTAL